MSDLYGVIKGSSKAEVTRRGTKNSGLEVIAATWKGAIKTTITWNEKTEEFEASVDMIPWSDQGSSKNIYKGKVNDES